jgi:hypothetical protein
MEELLLLLILGEVQYIQLEHRDNRLVLQRLRLVFFKIWRGTNSPVLIRFWQQLYRVQQKNLTIFKLKWNEQYTIFLCRFITKIIFNSKHFNYNIHFLNIMYVRWRPLLSTHFPKRFWQFCITCCSMLGEIATTSFLMFCFKSTIVLGFFSYTLLLRYPQRKKCCD